VVVSETGGPTTISSMAIASSGFPPQKAKNVSYDVETRIRILCVITYLG
jgi:hypothetical protein